MIPTNKKYTDDDTKLNPRVNPDDDTEDVNFKIETEIIGPGFKRLVQDCINL